jgi:hypothetical protein
MEAELAGLEAENGGLGSTNNGFGELGATRGQVGSQASTGEYYTTLPHPHKRYTEARRNTKASVKTPVKPRTKPTTASRSKGDAKARRSHAAQQSVLQAGVTGSSAEYTYTQPAGHSRPAAYPPPAWTRTSGHPAVHSQSAVWTDMPSHSNGEQQQQRNSHSGWNPFAPLMTASTFQQYQSHVQQDSYHNSPYHSAPPGTTISYPYLSGSYSTSAYPPDSGTLYTPTYDATYPPGANYRSGGTQLRPEMARQEDKTAQEGRRRQEAAYRALQQREAYGAYLPSDDQGVETPRSTAGAIGVIFGQTGRAVADEHAGNNLDSLRTGNDWSRGDAWTTGARNDSHASAEPYYQHVQEASPSATAGGVYTLPQTFWDGGRHHGEGPNPVPDLSGGDAGDEGNRRVAGESQGAKETFWGQYQDGSDLLAAASVSQGVGVKKRIWE